VVLDARPEDNPLPTFWLLCHRIAGGLMVLSIAFIYATTRWCTEACIGFILLGPLLLVLPIGLFLLFVLGAWLSAIRLFGLRGVVRSARTREERLEAGFIGVLAVASLVVALF